MAQTLSDIKTSLAAFGLRPKSRFGQNFLHDANQMARVVGSAGIRAGDLVLEVGAGTGALSERLLDAGVRLVTIEVDRDLEPILCQRLERYGEQVTVVIGDVLAGKHAIDRRVAQAVESAAVQTGPSGSVTAAGDTFKLIANLPYNVASPLLANLLTQKVGRLVMAEAVVMVQREVADRLCASPGNKDYGALGVLVQAIATVGRVAIVRPSCFWPTPKVDSAIIHLRRYDQPLTDHPGVLAQTLQRLFGQRRKQLGTILGRRRPMPEGIDPRDRPEQLTVRQLVTLSQWLNTHDEQINTKGESTIEPGESSEFGLDEC